MCDLFVEHLIEVNDLGETNIEQNMIYYKIYVRFRVSTSVIIFENYLVTY